jgi:anti-sigma factor RsiW
MSPVDLTCAELVELVTEYLDDALPDHELTRFEEHLVFCSPCVTHLEQMRRTIAATEHLAEEDLAPDGTGELLSAFRDWRRSRES